MLACYGIPCSFTKVLKTHKSIVWYYVQNAVSRGILSLVLWSQDIVPLAEMMTRSRASSVVVPVRLEISQRLVFPTPDWITAWRGGGGGPNSVFCFGRSCMWVQRLWRSSGVRVCQRVIGYVLPNLRYYLTY